MSLETVQYILDLIAANPSGTDPKAQGDDHIRNLKTALLNCLGGFPGAILRTGVDGGAANAYTVTLTPALPAYSSRMTVVFSPTVANTGASTINVSGLGAKALVSVSGAPLVLGDLVVGSIYSAFYDGTQFRLLSVTKNYIDQLAFNSTLPAQAGNAHKLLGTDGVSAAWVSDLKSATIRWADSTDVTKRVAFNLAGLTTGTTRTVTFGDRDVDLGLGYLKVSERQPSGTDGGAVVAADITQTRVLNTVEVNTIPGASLASNQITLPAGTYRYVVRAPVAALNNGRHKAFLYSVTDAAYAGIGSNGASSSTALFTTESWVSGQFTIATSRVFTIRHYTSSTPGSFGLALGIGQVEVYTEAEFWKVG